MNQRVIFKNIRQLCGLHAPEITRLRGQEMRSFPFLEDAWLAVENGVVVDFGEMRDWPGIQDWSGLSILDFEGRLVLPAFCDSHTHIVYASGREQEFVDRIGGLSYEEIASRGGGILNSVQKLRRASEDDLFYDAAERVREVMNLGTGAMEIKSGYGLDLESELKMLRVIRRLAHHFPIPISSTFLGAHAVPPEFLGRREAYVDHLCSVVLPEVAHQKLADAVDVFCERNYFSPEDTIRLLQKARDLGLSARVHANQLSHSGGVEAALEVGAISVDHLEYTTEENRKRLAASSTVATLLPGAAWFLNLPLPQGKAMLEAGCTVAVATDYNPGSSPTGNMANMVSMLCVQYGFLPEEALNAATINGAASLQLGHSHGSISIGKQANFVVTHPYQHYHQLPYYFGRQPVAALFVNGVQVSGEMLC
jgi:imidazolonepropionase